MSEELDYVRTLVDSAIYAPEHYIDVITLACAATHRITDLFSAPRILSLGLKGSGKSTLLTVASYLAANAGPPTGVLAMTAPSYVAEFRLQPLWTPAIDEINHLFGLAGSNGTHSKFYTYLNQGYRRDTAFAQHQENKVRLRIAIFCIAFLAGRGLAAPEDLRDRSIILTMEKAPASVSVADFSDPSVRASFEYGNLVLNSWMQTLPRLTVSDVKGLHPKLAHRMMDVWGPLFMVAKHAGDMWVKRALTAFERIELDAPVPVFTPEVQLRLDYLGYARLKGEENSIASGSFAEWAMKREHLAYDAMKPRQFCQFAVSVLGPTSAFHDTESGATRRGWAGTSHTLNMTLALRAEESAFSRLGGNQENTDKVEWEDF